MIPNAKPEPESPVDVIAEHFEKAKAGYCAFADDCEAGMDRGEALDAMREYLAAERAYGAGSALFGTTPMNREGRRYIERVCTQAESAAARARGLLHIWLTVAS
jgi:hypothetical protein